LASDANAALTGNFSAKETGIICGARNFMKTIPAQVSVGLFASQAGFREKEIQ